MLKKSIKSLSLLSLVLLSSCTVYYIEVNKNIYIHGKNNKAVQTGSDMKENKVKASPENTTDISAPIPIP